VSTVPAASGLVAAKQAALRLAQPLSVHLELTYSCNWRCVFCYNPRHFDRARMGLAEWTRVLDDLRTLGTLTVTLTGGEPLSHPEFLAIARAARERGFALRIFTNGSLVDEAMAEGLAGLHPLSVEMSLHGASAEVHDRATQKPGSFEAMFAGFERLRRRGAPLLLKVPLTNLNEHEVDGMVALAERLAAPLRIDPMLTPRDDGDRGPLAYSASSAAVRRLMTRLAELGRVPSARRVEGGTNCGLGRVTLAVDPEGNVFPCVQWRHTSLGNVREVPLAELWRSSPQRQEAAAVATRANQVLLEIGGPVSRFPFCPALAMQRTGDATRPDAVVLEHAQAAEDARRAALH
jgi:MoaA/NifB/PqqE/SkfB family radical SAM enzyme